MGAPLSDELFKIELLVTLLVMSKADEMAKFQHALISGTDKKVNEQLERFGVEGYTHGRTDRGSTYRSADAVQKDLIEAARNDYDLRRTLEASAMSGKKKANKILDKGFKSIGDINNATNFQAKAAKRHGQGGQFSSASDMMGLTQSMVERDRRKFEERLDGKYYQSEEAPKDPTDDIGKKANVVLSNHLQRAKDIVNDWEQGDQQVYADNSGALTQSTGIKETEPPSDKPDPAAVPIDLTDPDTFYNTKMNAYKSRFNLKPDF